MTEYVSFEKARELVAKLEIKSVKQYFEMFKNKKIPIGIPRNPNRDYVEFISWPDFLGNNNISAKDKEFLTYEKCQEFLLNAGIDSKEKFEEWRKARLNHLVPTRPDKTYKSQWKSWGEFFKTNRVSDLKKHDSFLSYNEAKEFLKQFNFKNEEEFYDWAKTSSRPVNIPASPRKTYGRNFVSMGDFLGNENFRTKNWISYNEYKLIIQNLKFNSKREFVNWAKINCVGHNYPANPSNVYPEFEGWPEFIGYDRRVSVGEKTISSILVTNGIEHKLQYTISDCKDTSVLPFDIAITKENELLCLIEYHGIQHFVAVEFFGGEAALKQTKKRDAIKRNYCRKNCIPLLEITYKENLEDKLGKFLEKFEIQLDFNLERQPALNKNFYNFTKAREIIQNMKIKSVAEFKNLKYKRPLGVPANPEIRYKNIGWVSWGDFLGTDQISNAKTDFVSYEEAKQWFADNKIESQTHWRKVRHHKPSKIPSNPDKIYKTVWTGWKNFLTKD